MLGTGCLDVNNCLHQKRGRIKEFQMIGEFAQEFSSLIRHNMRYFRGTSKFSKIAKSIATKARVQ